MEISELEVGLRGSRQEKRRGYKGLMTEAREDEGCLEIEAQECLFSWSFTSGIANSILRKKALLDQACPQKRS
jgi:hypothetical protein